MKLRVQQCEHCRGQLPDRNGGRLYCSKACRKGAWRARRSRPSTVAHKLATARDAAGLTLQQLERLTGIPNSTLSNYESGRATPPPKRAATLAKVLGADGLVGHASRGKLVQRRERLEVQFAGRRTPAERVVLERHRLHWTQQHLADRAGVNEHTIKRFEAGKRVSWWVVRFVGQALDLDLVTMEAYRRARAEGMTPPRTYGQAVRVGRYHRGLDQTEAAPLLGIKQGALSNIELDRRKVGAELAERIEALLGVPRPADDDHG